MWNRLSARDKLLLVILIMGAWFYAVYYFVLSPQIKAYAQIKSELETEKGKLETAKAMAAALSEEKARYRAAQQEVAKIEGSFETEMRDGAAVILLGLRSVARNVDVTGIEPSDIVTNKYSLEIPLKVTVQGDYLDLLAFIDSLENQALRNLAEVRSLKIVAMGSASTPGGTSQLSSEACYADAGGVKAEIGMVIYSAKNPRSKLQLEQLALWLRGRGNAFKPAGDVPPVPELTSHLKLTQLPPVNAASGQV
ncbi:MAG: type 4a pilus biogenesis protein PilO, partial [Thermacetogeniaceae bacterium]